MFAPALVRTGLCGLRVVRQIAQPRKINLSPANHSKLLLSFSLLWPVLPAAMPLGGYTIGHTQSAQTGESRLTLSRELIWCDPVNGGFLGLPVSTLSENAIQVTSRVRTGECAPPPPGMPFPPPEPFAIVVEMGLLLPGTYDVVWSIDNVESPPLSFLVSDSIVVVPLGQLPIAVPVSSSLASLLLAILLAASAARHRATRT